MSILQEKKSMKILIAEDDATTRKYLVTLLKKENFEVMETADGNEAWKSMQQDDAPSLLLLDWIMPGMDGEELCRSIRAQEREIKPYIIILTIKDQKDDIIRGLEAGADDYIPKPYHQGELFARINVGIRILELQQTLIAKMKKIDALLSEKELILKEVHHRIKNNMSTIYGFLVLKASTVGDPGAIQALEEAGGRVQSMLMIYKNLYQSDDFQNISTLGYLTLLADEIISNFSIGAAVKVSKHIDNFILPVKKLQSIGIIVNELLTNVMKYAFTGKSEGLITLDVTLKETHVTVSIADDGNGIPESVDFEKSTGFGLALVKGMSDQLGGTIRIERKKGTRIILEFEKS